MCVADATSVRAGKAVRSILLEERLSLWVVGAGKARAPYRDSLDSAPSTLLGTGGTGPRCAFRAEFTPSFHSGQALSEANGLSRIPRHPRPLERIVQRPQAGPYTSGSHSIREICVICGWTVDRSPPQRQHRDLPRAVEADVREDLPDPAGHKHSCLARRPRVRGPRVGPCAPNIEQPVRVLVPVLGGIPGIPGTHDLLTPALTMQ